MVRRRGRVTFSNDQMITIDCNPPAFTRAGLKTLYEASVLTLTCRAGLSGIRIADLEGALKLRGNTVRAILGRLIRLQLVEPPQRSTAHGCACCYQVTRKGAEVLNKALIAVPYVTTGAQKPLNLPIP